MSAKTKNDEPDTPEVETKAKYFKEQFDDEEVHVVFRKHPIVMRKGLIFGSVAILVGTIPGLVHPTYGWFFGGLAMGFVLGALVMMPWWIKWYFSVYILTDKRFIQQSRSMLQVNVVDISLEQIQMVNYQIVGLEQTLLHFGTIIVQTYVGDLVIHDVHHPEKIQKQMVHFLREMGVHPSGRPTSTNEARVIES
jgi:hypothetical protein